MEDILFVTQRRNDAIGRFDARIRKELSKRKHGFDFVTLKEKGDNNLLIFIHYIRNFIILLISSRGYKTIYFSRENPYLIGLKILFPSKYVVMNVHHVETYRGDSFIGRLLIKCTDHFFAISEFTKHQLEEIGAEAKDITVNYNGIDEAYYPEQIQEFQRYPYILYVGTEIPRKNLITVFSVFKKISQNHPDVRLVKIGAAGGQDHQRHTDDLLVKFAIYDKVIMMRDFISFDDLRKWYSNAVCCVSLSTLEGWGLTIPEAMACGCPIVASNIGPFREILGDDSSLIAPTDVEAAVGKIELFLSSPSAREFAKVHGLQRVKQFTLEVCIEKILAMKSIVK